MKKYLFPIIVGMLLLLAAWLGLERRESKPLATNSVNVEKNADSGDKSLEEYFRTAQDLAKPNTTPKQTTFLAVGDIMLSRSVASAIKRTSDPTLPFKNANTLLASTDFNFGNLESPLSSNSNFSLTGDLNFNVPPGFADGLKKYNFKIVNLANNHAYDQGKTGMAYTRKFLDDSGITHVGTGGNSDEAWQGQVITSNGIRIGFIGATYGVQAGGSNYAALTSDLKKLNFSIEELKEKSDFIVVTMHAGEEYKREPNGAQITFARAAIDAGADMVIGAHPHWVQPMEKYKDKYIFYSLGNFIFDQGWSQETKEGLTLKITLAGKSIGAGNNAATLDQLQGTKTRVALKQIELVPVVIENSNSPRVASEQEKQNILKKIGVTNPLIQ